MSLRAAAEGQTLGLFGRQRRRQDHAAARARRRCCARTRAACACSAPSCPRERWKVRGRVGYLGHEPLLYRELSGAREPALPRPAAPRGRGARGRAARRGGHGAPRRRPGARALPRHGAAAGGRRARCSTSPALLLLDEPRASLDPAARRAARAADRASRPGAPRVLVSHDVEGGLAEADLVLGPAGGPAGAAARRARWPADAAEALSVIAHRRRRSSARTCRSSCARRSRCRRWRSSAITVYVLFHFGLDRNALEGELAAGVLWVTLLLAAVIGVNRLFVAEREQGGIDGLLLAPDRPHRAVPRQGGRAVPFLRGGRVVAVPAFGLLLLGPGLGGALPELSLILLLGDIGLAAVGALVAALAAETRARELIVAAAPAAAAGAAADRLRAGHGAAACGRTRPPQDLGRMAGASRALRCGVRACLRSGFRLPARGLSHVLKGLRPLSIATVVGTRRGARARVLLRARSTPTRASSRRSSTSTCRWRSCRCCGFVAGGADGDQPPAHRRPRAGTCAPTWPSTCRSSWRSACSSPARSGPRRRGATGGSGTSRRWSRS